MDGPVDAAAATTVVTYAQLHRIAGERARNVARNRAFLGRLRRFAGRGEDAGADLDDPELIARFLKKLEGEEGFHNRTSALTQLRGYVSDLRQEDHSSLTMSTGPRGGRDASLQAVLTQALAAAGTTLPETARALFPAKTTKDANDWLTRTSHERRCIGALNRRKFFCDKDL